MKKLLVVIMLISCGCIFAQDKIAKIDELMNAVYNNGNFSGAVCVTEDGKPVYSKGFGFADINSKKLSAAETKFVVASITKQFTTAIIMKLAEEGKLKFTDKLSDYVKDYPAEYAGKVTLHHILSNTSGVPDFFSDEYMKGMLLKPHTYSDLKNIIKNKPLDFEPGSKFQWSNMAWEMLGEVIEKATGKTYAEVLKEKILIPLNLKNTILCRPDKKIKDLAAQGYVYKSGEYVPAPEFYFASQLAADGIITTVEDLAAFGNAEINGKLLSAESMKLMFTPYTQSDSRIYKYGYGWYVGDIKLGSIPKVSAKFMPGGMQGYQSMFINLDSRYSIALVSNYANAPMGVVMNTIANILLDQKYVLPKKPISPTLTGLIKSDGITAMMTELKKINESGKDKYQADENAMNQFAYELLNNGLVDESISVFKYIAEINPKSWNAYDSLAEALAQKGNVKEAIENYEKSIVLNPENKNGIEKLKELKEGKK